MVLKKQVQRFYIFFSRVKKNQLIGWRLVFPYQNLLIVVESIGHIGDKVPPLATFILNSSVPSLKSINAMFRSHFLPVK
jgi:hypothetical protein